MVLTQDTFVDYSKCPHIRDILLEFMALGQTVLWCVSQERQSIITDKTAELTKDLTILDWYLRKYIEVLDNGVHIIDRYKREGSRGALILWNTNIELSEIFSLFIQRLYMEMVFKLLHPLEQELFQKQYVIATLYESLNLTNGRNESGVTSFWGEC